MNTTTRIQCPTCGRNIAVRANGTLYTHGPAIARCPGRTEAADVDENLKRGYVECQDDDTHITHLENKTMSITTGSIIRLGTKATGRMHRIESIEESRWIAGRWSREIRLTRIDDNTTWKIDLKADAVRVPWNIRASRIITQQDRTQAIEEATREEIENSRDAHSVTFDNHSADSERQALETMHWLQGSTASDAADRLSATLNRMTDHITRHIH